jgi:membrane-associated phospholipid phosphatase
VKHFLRNNGWLLLLYACALSTALYFIFNYPKTTIHLYLNQFVKGGWLDDLFYFITYLGDGRLAGLALILILFYNIRLGIAVAGSFLTASLFSNSLKYLFFDDVNRPFFIFQFIQVEKLKYVEGVDLHIHNSFPSGHATQAFAILMLLAFVSSKNGMKLLFLALALLTAYSRVYLSQHWLQDVTAGSFIGTLFSCLWYYLIITRDKLPTLNKSSLALLYKK